MRDRVADVLAQRAALDRGAGAGVALSILLHGGLIALGVYSALHAPAPSTAAMVNIQFASAKLPPMTKAAEPVKKPAPKLEEPKPVIAEPKPEPPTPTPPQKPEKNTVPLSSFGQSTKKGSENPPAPPPTANRQPPTETTGTTANVAVGQSGITGLEGGNFPYTLYLEGMQRKIGTNWFRPSVQPGTEVIIYYRIQRDGKITDATVFKASGNATFDRAALSAVRSSSPLNPLPFAYSGTYLGVHLTFR
jgi:periplasmic protein TonB